MKFHSVHPPPLTRAPASPVLMMNWLKPGLSSKNSERDSPSSSEVDWPSLPSWEPERHMLGYLSFPFLPGLSLCPDPVSLGRPLAQLGNLGGGMAQCSPAYSKVAFVLEGAQRQPFHLPHQCVESGVRRRWGQQQHSSFTEGRPCPPLAGSPVCRGRRAGLQFQRGHSPQLLSIGRGTEGPGPFSSGLLPDGLH